MSLAVVVLGTGCAAMKPPAAQVDAGLVGAWMVTSSRPTGVGKNMLTFSSDGTFFRTGDSHPVLSGAHGAWKRIGDNEYHATYHAFRFERDGKWSGNQRTNIHVKANPNGQEFTGIAKVSFRDLNDQETGTSESKLQGKRIVVESF